MNKKVIMGILFVAIIYALYSRFGRSKNITLFQTTTKSSQSNEQVTSSFKSKILNPFQVRKENPDRKVKEELSPHQVETKKILKTFKKQSKMIIPFLPQMNFSEVDIDNNNVSIIHGTTPGANHSLTVIAARGVVSPKQALEFLKDEGRFIPNFGKKGLTLAKDVYTIPSIPGRGFRKTHSIFIGKPNLSGLTTNGILMTRADGTGTYLYLLKSHKDFFDKNEGAMDKLYEEIKLIDKK